MDAFTILITFHTNHANGSWHCEGPHARGAVSEHGRPTLRSASRPSTTSGRGLLADSSGAHTCAVLSPSGLGKGCRVHAESVRSDSP